MNRRPAPREEYLRLGIQCSEDVTAFYNSISLSVVLCLVHLNERIVTLALIDRFQHAVEGSIEEIQS